jgi:hypothetical protein
MTKIITFSPENPNGIERDMTVEEQAVKDNDIAVADTHTQERDDAIANKETLQASAKAKLIAGEALTEDEANTIVL